MLPFYVHKAEQGFTLIETTIIVMIVGILSAIAAPSYLAYNNKRKVNDAVVKVKGALQEVQREAIRKSRLCSVDFITDITTNPTTYKITSPCLVTGDRTLLKGVAMANNIEGTIKFSFRGNAAFDVTPSVGSTDTSGKIILFNSGPPISNKKCIAISQGIGIIRTGNYGGLTNDVGITSSNCSN